MSGLDNPESIIFHEESNSYFISNVNGLPLEKDNNGYITKVNSDGLVIVLRFIQAKEEAGELHAPKGMAIVNNVLYVADVDVVRGYNVDTGAIEKVIDLSAFEPQFLNDITADHEGNLYVSDMDGNQIFKILLRDAPIAYIFKSNELLGKPNGLYFDVFSKTLMVATWESGSVLAIDKEGNITTLKSGLQNLDGIFLDKHGNLFVSSHTEGEIYKISRRGKGRLSLFQTGLKTPADIAYDNVHDEVLVPFMSDNRVTSYSLKSFKR